MINNAEPALNDADGRRGLAINTRLLVYIPTTTDTVHVIKAWVTSDNADRRWIADTVEVATPAPSRLIYVDGSAEALNNAHPHGTPLDDADLITDDLGAVEFGHGALIGYEAMDGAFPSGFGSDGIFTLKIGITEAK